MDNTNNRHSSAIAGASRMEAPGNLKPVFFAAALCLFLSSCSIFPEGINQDPNEVTDKQMQVKNYKIGANILALEGLVVPIEEHMYQFIESLSGGPFAGYIGCATQFEAKFETYNPSSDWRKCPFADVITETYAPYRAVENGTDDPVSLALATLLKVAIMHRVTDTYGPIPYSALEGNDEIYVGYDTQEQVYMKMFEELDYVIDILKDNVTLGTDAWSNYDSVYYGDISKWAKYAASLKLRMAMRLSYVKPDLAREKAAEAIASGLISSNAENAAMHATENRMTLIYNDWEDHRVGRDLINYMNGYEDPRRAKMFTTVLVGSGNNKYQGYRGVPIGLKTTLHESIVKSFSNMIVTSDTPYMWFCAAESAFLRAEYELRWGSETSAAEWYKKGIELSFEERGATGAAEYAADGSKVPEGGKSDITIAWQPGSFERNLERLITQKWIAIFPLGNEGWCERRRTGYPKLYPVEDDLSGGTVDVNEGACRLTYPVEEYALNRANLDAAIVMLNDETPQGSRFSGDIMGTKLWWDCKVLLE